ncbi:MAG: hypothetical protein II567_09380 [Candidatus Riflebacteria bacterium]|nr:hypothetical protein [Candidatus Riflebacteria bacterium]
MKGLFPHKKQAFGLVEVVIALLVIVCAGIPILKMVFQTRTETSSSVNYLRAMELADEIIEWANASKFQDVDQLEKYSGSIMNISDSKHEMIKVNTSKTNNENWKSSGLFEENLKYSDHYCNAYFYRDIKVEPVTSQYNNFGNNLLKKVTVKIKWSEGRMPSNINLDSDRNREIQLSVLVINDDNLLF